MLNVVTNKLYRLSVNHQKIIENIVTFIFIFYLQLIGKAISQNLIVIENLVSWFLPTGIKYCAFIFLPFRLWPVTLITFVISSIYLGSFDYNVELRDWFFRYIYSLKTIFIFAIAAKIYRDKYNSFKLSQLNALIYWLSCFCIAGLINGALISVEAFKFSNVSTYKILEFIGALAIGDFVGALIVLPIFIVLNAFFNKAKIKSETIAKSVGIILFVAIINTAIVFFKPELLYGAQLVALICLVMVHYKKGYIVGNITLFSINTAIVVNTYLGIRADVATPDQLFIVTLSLVGLLLGAAFEEQKRTNQSLEATNNGLLATTKKLSATNKILLEVNELNQDLAKRNTEVQELEKQRISQELHDEFGQQLTALKTNTHILNNINVPNNSEKYLNRISHISDELYSSLKGKLSQLRPYSLITYGLKWSIENDKILNSLVEAGINFTTSIKINEATLSETIKMAIFRIVQEATNNTIKYADAKQVRLTVVQRANIIRIDIIDDGVGFDINSIKTESNHGLTIINERALSLAGKLKIKSTVGKGTKITVLLKLDKTEQSGY